jgi:Mediator complex protein
MAEATSNPPPAAAEAPVKSFTPFDRIAELNDIDQSVSLLLSSAAEAVGTLSNSPQNLSSSPKTLASAQALFKKSSSTYFSTLSAIEVRLRRQVYALEEAGLVEPGEDRDVKAGRAIGSGNDGRAGGGPLDPSWLNAKADNSVELAMRRELVDQAKDFLDRVNSDAKDEPPNNTEPRNGTR